MIWSWLVFLLGLLVGQGMIVASHMRLLGMIHGFLIYVKFFV